MPEQFENVNDRREKIIHQIATPEFYSSETNKFDQMSANRAPEKEREQDGERTKWKKSESERECEIKISGSHSSDSRRYSMGWCFGAGVFLIDILRVL